MARLYEHYQSVVRDKLVEQFGYANAFEVPRLDKIVLNMGVGEATLDRKKVDGAVDDLTRIAGQRPVVTVAKKSEATFKLREGMNIGAKVTLRRARMYEFLDRLITIALPRVRDFRGLNPKSFDGRGNFAMGIKEQIVFPEIDYDKTDTIRGMDIIICTTADSDEEALELLRGFDMPFPAPPKEEEEQAPEQPQPAQEAAEAQQEEKPSETPEQPEQEEQPQQEQAAADAATETD